MGHGFDEVLLVRHGETEWNRTGRRQGRLDSPLTSEGRRHVDVLADGLAASGADALYSSPLGRARATARPIAAATGLALRVIHDLTEVDHGQFSGLTNAEIDQRRPGAMAAREADKLDWCFPDGESYRDAGRRAERALDTMAAAGARRPIVVTHEMVGRMIRARLLGLARADALHFRLAPATVVSINPGHT